MSFIIKKIIISKTGESSGSASVKIEDGPDIALVLNKFQIDLNSGEGPVSVLKHEGTMLFSGSLIDQLSDIIFELFNSLSDEKPGMYEAKKGAVVRI